MKNYRVILGVVLFLTIVGLSGCQKTTNENGNHPEPNDSKFIGDWEVANSTPDYETFSFYENGSVKDSLDQIFEGQTLNMISWFGYTIDNTTVCLSTKNVSAGSPDYISVCYAFSFSNNATRLSLSSNGILVMDLVKIS